MGKINESEIDYWLTDDGLLLIKSWARDGLSQTEIADRIGIAYPTLTIWKQKYEDIAKALSEGKEIVDYKVENALLKAALGYKVKEVKVTIGRRQINGQWVDITKETTEKEVGPNHTAALAWLNNRKPEMWRRKDKIVEVDDEENDIKITIERGRNNDLDDSVNSEMTMNAEEIKEAQKELTDEANDPWAGWENW